MYNKAWDWCTLFVSNDTGYREGLVLRCVTEVLNSPNLNRKV